MKRSNPAVWTIIGAIVGVFLTPSGWVLLLAAFVGPQLANLGNSTSTAPTDTLPPELGGGTIGEDAPANGNGGGWFLALILVALVITVLSAVFFGWVGRRLAEARNSRVDVLTAPVA
jgi:hypothetical protein